MVNSHFPCKIQNGGFTRLRKFFNENKLEGVSIVKIFTDTWEKETNIMAPGADFSFIKMILYC